MGGCRAAGPLIGVTLPSVQDPQPPSPPYPLVAASRTTLSAPLLCAIGPRPLILSLATPSMAPEAAAAPNPALVTAALPAVFARRRHSLSVPALSSSALASLKKSLCKFRPSTSPRKPPAVTDGHSLQPAHSSTTFSPPPPATSEDTPLERRRSTYAAIRRRLAHPPRPSVAGGGERVPPATAAEVPAAPATIPTVAVAGAAAKDDTAWRRQLTRAEYAVLRCKGTERPFSGAYDSFFPELGHFVCAACAAPLYSSEAKFHAGCGWPAFEACYSGAVDAVPDGRRTEIVCSGCRGHLGHVFTGERMTATNERHCVNSVSVKYRKGASPALPEGKARRSY